MKAVILAGGLGTRFNIDSAVMLLPHPDSPTMPSVSPFKISKERSSTALPLPEGKANSVVK